MASQHLARLTGGFLASVYVSLREFNRAADLLARMIPPGTPPQSAGQRQCYAARAELQLARGDTDAARATVAQMLGETRNLSEGVVIARLWQLRGNIHRARGEWEAAERDLAAAAQTAAQQQLRPRAWRVNAELAQLYHQMGRADDAARHERIALSVIEQLAAGVPDASLRSLFRARARAYLRGER